MAKNFVKAIQLGQIDGNDLDELTPFFADGLPEAAFMIRINNASDQDVFISYDGVVGDIVQSGAEATINFQTNASPNGYAAYLRKGTDIYAISVSGQQGNGDVFLAAYYQES